MPRLVPALLVALLLAVFPAPGRADALPRATPESRGIASADLLALVDALDAHGDAKRADGVHSVMVVRHGHVVLEGWWAPYAAGHRHQLYSLSKSFTSTAVGIARAEGRLSIDDPVTTFFPEECPSEPSPNLKAMRVADLLRMATGQQSEPPTGRKESWVKQFLAQPVPFKPGTHFLYNTPATYMQSAIVQKVSGEKLVDFLGPRLFLPLAIESPTWETSPEGICTGGYGLSVRTGDIASFGQLLLNRGTWNGRQLVPGEWIDAATSRQVANGSNPASDWDQGYGYQFWRCRHGAYRGDGAFGQFCVVLPEQEAVVAITAGTGNMQGVLDILWSHLLPALRPVAIPEDAEGHRRLQDRLAGLRVPLPGADAGDAAWPAALAGTTYRFADNDAKLASVRMEPAAGDEPATLVLESHGHTQRIPCGRGRWLASHVAWGGSPPAPAAAAIGTDGGARVVRICFVETPFVATLRLEPEGSGVKIGGGTNVGFGPTTLPELVGQPAAAK